MPPKDREMEKGEDDTRSKISQEDRFSLQKQTWLCLLGKILCICEVLQQYSKTECSFAMLHFSFFFLRTDSQVKYAL